MEGRINVEVQSLKIIYKRNKPYIIPGVVIFVSILLIIQVVVPQFRTLSLVREEAKQAAKVLDELKKDLSVLVSQDQETLESQLRVSSLALPINKDFGGILNALYSAAARSGVNIGRFSFKVGDLESKDEKDVKFSTIDLSVNLDHDTLAINSFIDTIGKTLPISDISLIRTDNKISNIGLLFYYRTLPPASLKKGGRIVPLSQKNLELLSTINDFNNTVSTDIPAESSPSARSTNPFAP